MTAMERATMLLVDSMQEADAPIAQLGDAIVRMVNYVGSPTADVETLRLTLTRELAVCIEALQYHDRLMQQLTQARAILTGSQTNSVLTYTVAPAGAGTVELF